MINDISTLVQLMEKGYTPRHEADGWKILRPDHETGIPQLVDVSVFAITQAKRFDCIEVVRDDEGYVAVLKQEAEGVTEPVRLERCQEVSILCSKSRLLSLERTGLMDSPPEEDFDRLTDMAATLLHCPVALITLIDGKRQFFKSAHGLCGEYAESRGSSLGDSICKFVVMNGKELIVSDSAQHLLIKDLPIVSRLNIQAYAGYPLWSHDKQRLGAFSIIDHKTRIWSKHEMMLLLDLASMANLCIDTAELRLKLAARFLERQQV